MCFPMAHLDIAYNILMTTSQIKNPNDFMLGSLAPDSVHFRDNYQSDMKKISHLCVGDEKWGQATNNEEWLKNVLAFLQENKNSVNIDFIYGYCCHIIADIQNNIKIWTPFRLENREALEKGLGSRYHQEAYETDYALYALHHQNTELCQILEKGISYDIPNIVSATDIDKMKVSILYNQFAKREPSDISLNRYATLENIQEFISTESQYIKNVLFRGI